MWWVGVGQGFMERCRTGHRNYVRLRSSKSRKTPSASVASYQTKQCCSWRSECGVLEQRILSGFGSPGKGLRIATQSVKDEGKTEYEKRWLSRTKAPPALSKRGTPQSSKELVKTEGSTPYLSGSSTSPAHSRYVSAAVLPLGQTKTRGRRDLYGITFTVGVCAINGVVLLRSQESWRE